MKTLLKTDEYFTFVKKETCKGVEFEVYIDDYGMTYVLAWKDETGEVNTWGCGMCNDYHIEMEDIADYVNLPL